jgi:TonB family protein
MRRPLSLLALAVLAAACSVPFVGAPDVFQPRSDYGFPPTTADYTEPGDCQGGSRLAAQDVAEPEYPSAAFRRGQQGWVVLRLDVDPEGRARNVQVVDSQPRGPFDGAARRTVRSWRFQPPGEPGLTRCVVVLDYRLGVGRIGL